MGSFASLKKVNDIAYSSTYGASVRKQWKDLVLAGNHPVSECWCHINSFSSPRQSQTDAFLFREEMQVDRLL